jgi:hypothetical protein
MLDRLVEVFCEVDDFCKTFQPQWQTHQIDGSYQPHGPKPGLADSEIITLLLVLSFTSWPPLPLIKSTPLSPSSSSLQLIRLQSLPENSLSGLRSISCRHLR